MNDEPQRCKFDSLNTKQRVQVSMLILRTGHYHHRCEKQIDDFIVICEFFRVSTHHTHETYLWMFKTSNIHPFQENIILWFTVDLIAPNMV
jgi:hypothetical protein